MLVSKLGISEIPGESTFKGRKKSVSGRVFFSKNWIIGPSKLDILRTLPLRKTGFSTLPLEGLRILRVEAILIYFVLPIGQAFPIKRRAIWTPGIWQHTTPPPVESKSNRGSERKKTCETRLQKKSFNICHNKSKDCCKETPKHLQNFGLKSSIRLFETGFSPGSHHASGFRHFTQRRYQLTTFDWTYATSRRRCTNIWCCRSWRSSLLGPIPKRFVWSLRYQRSFSWGLDTSTFSCSLRVLQKCLYLTIK